MGRWLIDVAKSCQQPLIKVKFPRKSGDTCLRQKCCGWCSILGERAGFMVSGSGAQPWLQAPGRCAAVSGAQSVFVLGDMPCRWVARSRQQPLIELQIPRKKSAVSEKVRKSSEKLVGGFLVRSLMSQVFIFMRSNSFSVGLQGYLAHKKPHPPPTGVPRS